MYRQLLKRINFLVIKGLQKLSEITKKNCLTQILGRYFPFIFYGKQWNFGPECESSKIKRYVTF